MRRSHSYILILGLLIGGCANVTPQEFTKGAAEFVVVQTARHEFIEGCDTRREVRTECSSEFDEIRREGSAAYDEERGDGGLNSKDKLSDEFDEFMNRTNR